MRDEPRLAAPFCKDAGSELFLRRLNEILAPHEEQECGNLRDEFPILHIIGAPRSGTTLLSQLIGSTLDVGYINNLVAAFWRAPSYGIRLSRKLLPARAPSAFTSTYGRTKELWEPHEFGYFWSDLLNYRNMHQTDEQHEDSIDWDRARRVLTNMTHAFNAPLVLKSFLVAWHIGRMAREVPRTCFVRIRREPVANAASILAARREYLGSMDRWFSLKPKQCQQFDDAWPAVQVAAQVFFLEEHMKAQLSRLRPQQVLELSYEQMCQNPRQAITEVKSLLEAHGPVINWVADPPECLEVSRPVETHDELIREVRDAIDYFYEDRSNRASERVVTNLNQSKAGVSG